MTTRPKPIYLTLEWVENLVDRTERSLKNDKIDAHMVKDLTNYVHAGLRVMLRRQAARKLREMKIAKKKGEPCITQA